MVEVREYVSPARPQDLLTGLEALPGTATEGFFGPDSVTWRVNRESGVFLGAGRAALLQLAHPWVAASLTQHSNLLHDAIGRFHSTFRVIYTMLFGTRAQTIQASRQLYRRHTSIRGELHHPIGPYPRGEVYEANEVSALRWVYATLVESAILAYELILPPLSSAAREQYYLESKRMAALFGIPPKALPADWPGFLRYTADMLASPLLDVDDHTRALGESVLSGVGTRIHPPLWYRSLTALWLPPRLRVGFRLEFGAAEEESAKRAARWLPRIYPHLPPSLRFVGPFGEAEARLQERPPRLMTRISNQFWMGQPRLLYSQLAEQQSSSAASDER